eukprot:3365051-Pyramimonas_sp.AAC.1
MELHGQEQNDSREKPPWTPTQGTRRPRIPPALWAEVLPDTHPTLPSLGLGGGGPKGSRALVGPRWLQEGLRERKMASKMAQDSSRWLKIASDTHQEGLKAAPRRIHVPIEPSTAPPKMPSSFKSLGNS